MIRCILCKQKLGRITHTHLWHAHNMLPSEFRKRFPNSNWGAVSWNKGKTKETHPTLARLSLRLKQQKEWNFSSWQSIRKTQQIIQYKELSKDTVYIQPIANLITKIFHKSPSVIKRKNENATVVCLYQCKISKRLDLPCGNKIKNNVGIPSWISSNTGYMIRCLKGLFETDGCFHEYKDNYTRVIEFKNNCAQLRDDVYRALLSLKLHPQFGQNYVRLARRNEVYGFKELIDFRNY